VPGLLADFNLHHLASMLFVALSFFDFFMRKTRPKLDWMSSLLTLLFIANLLIIIGFRGTGFRFLGDENWGGMRYVFITLSGFLFLSSTYVTLDKKYWTIAIFMLCFMGVLPFISELLFTFSGGTFYLHYYFFEFAGATALNFENLIGEGVGVGRFQTARLAGESIALFVIAFWYVKKIRLFSLSVLLPLAAILTGISGHRIGVIRLILIMFIYFFVTNKNTRARFLSFACLAGIFALAGIYASAPYLPQTVQRSVSFLPGINIDFNAEISAFSTSEWRLNVWRDALSEIPNYFWLGKGYTFPANIQQQLMLSGTRDHIERWAFETSAFHNGLLSLLIGMGISGLLIGCGLLIHFVIRFYRIATKDWENKDLYSFFVSIFALNTVNIIMFFTLYGDVQVSFPRIFFFSMVLQGVILSERKSQTEILNL
jgi:O-antigen ligase